MNKKNFELKEEHLKLLRHFCVGWQDCEFGAPEIDPKRPYGNSDAEQDMVELLGLKELRQGVFEFELFGQKFILKGEDRNNIEFVGAEDEKLLVQLRNLHKETETALQIVLATGKFEAGNYEADEYLDNWTVASPSKKPR